MYQSQSVATTLREIPGEADVASHRLLLRAGFIRQQAAGIYSYLPLGLRVLRRIESIIRQEMEAVGAQELLLPALQPASLWQRSGRDLEYGEELMQVTDRHGRSFVLGPTHEEAITALMDGLIDSYRRLPVTVYQIQSKYRDERRPRSGLLRSREFLMKDAYSLAASGKQSATMYEAMHAAYTRIFTRCGLQFVSVRAEAGQMGGTGQTHEFLALSEIGEDELIICQSCGYAAHPHLTVQSSVLAAAACTADDLASHCCPVCHASDLQPTKAIEVGHIFLLGDTYSQALNAGYLDATGEKQPFVMSCYGIGVSRLLAALAEQHHDADGLCWPQAIAPYDAHILVLNDDAETMQQAETVAAALRSHGAAVLIDDRPLRPGVKFKDADLLGIPNRLTLGRKSTLQAMEFTQRSDRLNPLILTLSEVVARICTPLLP